MSVFGEYLSSIFDYFSGFPSKQYKTQEATCSQSEKSSVTEYLIFSTNNGLKNQTGFPAFPIDTLVFPLTSLIPNKHDAFFAYIQNINELKITLLIRRMRDVFVAFGKLFFEITPFMALATIIPVVELYCQIKSDSKKITVMVVIQI